MNSTKRALVPKLRFPEFREAGEWVEKRLGHIGDVLMCKRIFAEETNDLHGVPFYKIGTLGGQPDAFISKELFSEYRSKYNYPIKGEILITCSGTVGKCLPYDGNAAYYQDSNIVWIDNPTLEISNEFLHNHLLNVNWGKLNSTTITRIYGSDLRGLSVVFPAENKEQQQIADCLSSLDELVTLEAQKLGTLKAHKKGLMQQLFPAEGETLPKLRFPEFQDAGKWCCDSLGKIFETSSGGTPSRSTKEYWTGKIPWITTSLVNFNVIYKSDEFISEKGLEDSSAKIFPKGTMLIAMYGQGKTRGKVAMLGIEAATNQACAAILPKKEIDPVFVFLNLGNRYDEMRELSNSGGQENLSQGLIKELPFSFPQKPAEQQKIADCLSSLDDLITAQTQKLDTLKAHKKGLMQHLFPSAEAEKDLNHG